MGWGQSFEPEKPRNAFNPHHQEEKLQPNYKRQTSQTQQQVDIFGQNKMQMKQPQADSLEQFRDQY